MTQQEKNALSIHNMIFTKRAIRLENLRGFPYRFKVIYNDGTEKFDYECGCHTRDIANYLEKII